MSYSFNNYHFVFHIYWKMPVIDYLTAVLQGIALVIWPIMIVIIAAVFIYNLVVHTKVYVILLGVISYLRSLIFMGLLKTFIGVY